jgi:hypothetical protein
LPLLRHRLAVPGKKIFFEMYQKPCSLSSAWICAYWRENRLKNGKFFTVASAPLLLIHIRI